MKRITAWLLLISLLVLPAALVVAAERPGKAAIASAHPLATQAGMQILTAGGNAFDAALAAMCAACVVEPVLTSLGGGGFLLASVLTAPQEDEVLPAAVTDSPSPMTTDEFVSGMVTEEVEPGVFRVVNDGARDPTLGVAGYPGATVDVAPDGGVWLSGDGGRQGLFRLGEERSFEGREGWPPYLEVAPDGSLWRIGEASDLGDSIFSFDGDGWTLRATTTGALRLGSLAVGPDGEVWATDRTGMTLLRLADDGTLTTVDDWAEVYSGVVSPDELAVSPAGDVWLIGMVRWDGPCGKGELTWVRDDAEKKRGVHRRGSISCATPGSANDRNTSATQKWLHFCCISRAPFEPVRG